LVIASTCSERDLYEHAGEAGKVLFAKAKAELASAEGGRNQTIGRDKISLASGALWNPPLPVD